MKTRLSISSAILLALVLSACSQAASPGPGSEGPLPVETETPVVLIDEESGLPVEVPCSRSSDEVRLLINGPHGYCLQYPAEYDIFHPNETEVHLFRRSVLSVDEPSVRIQVQPTAELTLEGAADQVVQQYAIPGTPPRRESVTLGGEDAILLAGLSGQDPNSQVVVLHDGRLYTLTFIEMDPNNPEAVARAEALYSTIVQSFNFRPESNACPGCAPPEEDPGSAMISGWVWHDVCDSGQDGEPAPSATPPGCIREDSPLGVYHADGILTPDEPLIEGVVVTLGQGACPSTGLAEATTIITDLSYSFSSLPAGEYCLSIDPQHEPNFSILTPGLWSYPAITQGVIGATVTVGRGEYLGMVNFGWDYQFQP